MDYYMWFGMIFTKRFLKGEPVVSSGDYKIESAESRIRGEFNHSLFIDNCKIDQSGDVKATATNVAGEVSCEAKLDITGN